MQIESIAQGQGIGASEVSVFHCNGWGKKDLTRTSLVPGMGLAHRSALSAHADVACSFRWKPETQDLDRHLPPTLSSTQTPDTPCANSVAYSLLTTPRPP